ncbi:hypothetical protein H4219_003990 [Mycoemilia scoparia]|uniref:Uncharacterized protein n=1 Tax=Mycoemilia scoparia TaxID=417184 RepID=A0A9W8DNH9_9FUNG|nr:hypothetical protein H4219_003990 [Mycoemilia scoparia]
MTNNNDSQMVVDDDSEQDSSDEDTVFQMFANTAPKHIKTTSEPEIIYTQAPRELELEESDNEERIARFKQIAVDADWVHKESKIPWARNFALHKVIHLPTTPVDKETGKPVTKKNLHRRKRRPRQTSRIKKQHNRAKSSSFKRNMSYVKNNKFRGNNSSNRGKFSKNFGRRESAAY